MPTLWRLNACRILHCLTRIACLEVFKPLRCLPISYLYTIIYIHMALYSIDKLIEETRRLAAEFRRSTGTMLPVSGEIARYDVSHQLGLDLVSEAGGYDATGNQNFTGKRILIKSRVIGESVKSGHRIGQLNPDGNWDMVIVSLMNNDFEPAEMYMATREEITEALADKDSKRGKRGALSVAKFKIIGELIWTREQGLEPARCHAG